MLKTVLLLIFGFLLCVESVPLPQDFEDIKTGMLMAAAQVKEVVDEGAAARNSNGVEFFGIGMNQGTEFGFGDALKRGRRALLPSDAFLSLHQRQEKLPNFF